MSISKYFALALSVPLFALAIGCGGNTPPAQSPEGASTAEAPAPPSAPAAPSSTDTAAPAAPGAPGAPAAAPAAGGGSDTPAPSK